MQILKNKYLLPVTAFSLALLAWGVMGQLWITAPEDLPISSTEACAIDILYFLARAFLLLGVLASVFVIGKHKIRNLIAASSVILVGFIIFQVHEHQIKNQALKECLNTASQIETSHYSYAKFYRQACYEQ
jgi:uncharacterized membrane protein